jgi:hypothetical protein
MRNMDDKKKAAVYLLMLNRYRDLINERETKTITEIRSMVKPRQPYVEILLKRIIPEWPQIGAMEAIERLVGYLRSVETCEFALTFWMKPEEMDELRVADQANKSILFAAFLRSLGFEKVKVFVMKSGSYYVWFFLNNEEYLFLPKNNMLIKGEEISKLFAEDSPRYAFSDLSYESFEE